MSLYGVTHPKAQTDWSTVRGSSAPSPTSKSLLDRIISIIKRILGCGSSTNTPSAHHSEYLSKKEICVFSPQADLGVAAEFLIKAETHMQKREWDDTLATATKGLPFADTHEAKANLYIQKTEILMQKRKLPEAYLSAKAGLELTGISPDTKAKFYCLKAEILKQNNEWGRALAQAKAGLQLPSISSNTKAKFYILKAELHMQNKTWVQARTAVQDGFAFTGTSPETRAKLYIQKAELHMQNKTWDQALIAAKAGLELTGVSPETGAKLSNLKESAEIVLQTLDSSEKRSTAPHQKKLVRRGRVQRYSHPKNYSEIGIRRTRRTPKSIS